MAWPSTSPGSVRKKLWQATGGRHRGPNCHPHTVEDPKINPNFTELGQQHKPPQVVPPTPADDSLDQGNGTGHPDQNLAFLYEVYRKGFADAENASRQEIQRLQTLIQEQARDREAANKETKAWKLYQGKLFKTLEGQQEQYRQQIEGQKQEIKAQQQQIQAQQLQLQALELQQESFDTLKSI